MVDHFILGNILLDKNIPADLVLLLMHYLRNQTARVVWNGTKGGYHTIDEGVRQGGILSPILFKLYIDAVLSDISDLEIGCKLGFVQLNILAYADDIVIVADTKENLERIYLLFVDKIRALKLKINTTKSKCMVFETSRFGSGLQEIRLGDDTLQNVTKYKYLGHMIQRNLIDNEDIESRLRQFYMKFNTTFRNFKNVSVETFIHLFCSYCLPDYGLPLWNSLQILNKHIFNVFCVAYSNALKKILGVSRTYSSHDVADYCGLYLLKHYIAVIQSRYFKRIFKSNNPLIKLCQPYLLKGMHLASFFELLKNRYSVDFRWNELDIIICRISWVQRNETRTGLRF